MKSVDNIAVKFGELHEVEDGGKNNENAQTSVTRARTVVFRFAFFFLFSFLEQLVSRTTNVLHTLTVWTRFYNN